jgi:hypothetical protein
LKKIPLLLPFLLLLACGQEETAVTEAECFQLAAGTHSPRLTQDDDDISVSYVKTSGEKSSLFVQPIHLPFETAVLKNELRSGTDWFINWADFPSVVKYKDSLGNNVQFSHWLQYSGEGTYDYDIYAAIEYSESKEHFKLHKDTVAAEHGFLSSAPIPGGGLQVSWLDGRFTKQVSLKADEPTVDDHGHGGGGAMTLRTKALSDDTSVELDHRVCDCCNTATVATDSLIMVAYRDRSEHEIRDIAYVTKPTSDDEWSTPKLVHADNWEINGCPVNGPALAANDAGDIAVVWYTAPADLAQINFARYDPNADSFNFPILLDDEIPLGRVDIQLADDGAAYVTGITTKEGTDDAFLTLWTISPTDEVEREELTITSAARSSGFLKIALFEDKLYWARTVLGVEKEEQFVEVCWR